MNVARKCIVLIAGAFSLLISPSLSHATAVLDIGTQYRLRGISFQHPGFGADPDQNYSYYSERATAHIGGRFSPNIEMMTQFQALGVAGSSTSVSNPVINQAGSRYPNTNFSPWVQWAYLRARRLFDQPMDLTIGRQDVLIGDGFLLSDDDLGFTGIRIQNRLPWWGLQSDIFTFKTGDRLTGDADADIYGVQLIKPLRNIRYSVFLLVDRDATGATMYVRPSEDPNRATGASFLASRINRTYYDARIEGRLLEGGFYKAEFALQRGHVSRDPALDSSTNTLNGFSSSVDLAGYGMLLSAGLYTRTSKYGPIEVHGTFGMGSGDTGDIGKDSAFAPPHAHRFDGLERSGFGEFYGASVFDAIASSANPRGLPPGFSGIRIIGGGVTAHPSTLLSVGIDYFVYDAMEAASAKVFPTTSSDSSLGSEFDIGAGFAYTNYLTFRASAAFFSPGKAFQNRSQARRFLIEAIGRF